MNIQCNTDPCAVLTKQRNHEDACCAAVCRLCLLCSRPTSRRQLRRVQRQREGVHQEAEPGRAHGGSQHEAAVHAGGQRAVQQVHGLRLEEGRLHRREGQPGLQQVQELHRGDLHRGDRQHQDNRGLRHRQRQQLQDHQGRQRRPEGDQVHELRHEAVSQLASNSV